jgi:hypothetical protein
MQLALAALQAIGIEPDLKLNAVSQYTGPFRGWAA